jgi:uncharacterized Ntn-hydrolase superfamily protein
MSSVSCGRGRGRRRWSSMLLGVAAALQSASAMATWSIVAVDPDTREVGSAGASCTPFVAGIVGLVPGRGVIVAQAMSNMAAKRRGMAMIASGAGPDDVIAEITTPSFDPHRARQQYGVAVLGGGGRAGHFTGSGVAADAAAVRGPTASVQGNILPTRRVVDAAMEAFASADGPLSNRLLLALEAGGREGGDRRCGGQTAHSAYLAVAGPRDDARRPRVRIVIGDQSRSGRNPVALVRAEYDARAVGAAESAR